MDRFINVAGGQLGPIARDELRQQVVSRLLELMREAKARGGDIVVFPELALTTFFPRWWIDDQAQIDSFFEREMPSPATRPLFETAKSLGIGFYLGYAELAQQNGVAHRYNTAILVDKNAEIVGKYRKVHLPGHADDRPHYPFQHLEKRYFEPGDLGFPVWRAFGANVGMCICNDRRWPETYRVMGMQSVELILLGYNTPTHLPWIPVYDHLADFHNHLCMQAGAYQNSTWVVGVAKAGNEEGSELLAGSCIISPSGEIVAQAASNGDEVFLAKCNLEISRYNKEAMFNFAQHRRIEHYQLIAQRAGAVPPVCVGRLKWVRQRRCRAFFRWMNHRSASSRGSCRKYSRQSGVLTRKACRSCWPSRTPIWRSGRGELVSAESSALVNDPSVKDAHLQPQWI